jgi:hypothetical protein
VSAAESTGATIAVTRPAIERRRVAAVLGARRRFRGVAGGAHTRDVDDVGGAHRLRQRHQAE